MVKHIENATDDLPIRKLRWRVTRGSHWMDLVEERRGDEPPAYVGLVDGRETLRTSDRRAAETSLIQAGCV